MSNEFLFLHDTITYKGQQLQHHLEESKKFIKQHELNNARVVAGNPGNDLEQFFISLREPNKTGYLFYCGHGTPSGWSGVSRFMLNKQIDQIHSTSQVVIFADCCHADCCVPTSKRQWIYMSSSRCSGKNSSGFYTGEGGWMMRCVFRALKNRMAIQELERDVDSMYAQCTDTSHLPKIFYSDCVPKNLTIKM